jgi:hypothetical protein
MPWYAKLVLSVSLSLITVLGTMAAVADERAWNTKSILCLVAALFIAAGMGVLTYYYHLHEEDDTQDEDSQAALSFMAPGRHGV